MITQGLNLDYIGTKCRYCEGRGFTLVSSPPYYHQEVTPNLVIECKFCNGTGNRVNNVHPSKNKTKSRDFSSK